MKKNKYKSITRKELSHFIRFFFEGILIVMYGIFARVEAMFQSLCYQFNIVTFVPICESRTAIFADSQQNKVGIDNVILTKLIQKWLKIK